MTKLEFINKKITLDVGSIVRLPNDPVPYLIYYVNDNKIYLQGVKNAT